MASFSMVMGESLIIRGSKNPHSLARRRKSFQYNAPTTNQKDACGRGKEQN